MTSLTIDNSGLEARFRELKANQIPSAIRNTLNDLAFDTRKRMIQEMQRIFDKPTAAVLRVPYVNKATKGGPGATLFLSDYQDSKGGKGPSHALTHHMTGGPDTRGRKGIEKRLQSIGLLAANEWLVPAVGAKLNANGNMTGAQSMKILADIGGLGQYAGDASNTNTKDRMVRGKGGKPVKRKGKKLTYYWVRRSKAAFSTNVSGVFRKVGAQFVPVMAVVRSTPKYVKRFKWREVVNSYTKRRIEYHARRAIAQAIAKANR